VFIHSCEASPLQEIELCSSPPKQRLCFLRDKMKKNKGDLL